MLRLTKLLKTIGSRVYNFFVGPRLVFGREYTGEDGWTFMFGPVFWWDSAPVLHFDSIGVGMYFGTYLYYVMWKDNN